MSDFPDTLISWALNPQSGLSYQREKLQVFGVKTRFLGEWLGLKKPGFYGGLGWVVNVWEKNPVSGWLGLGNLLFNNRRFVF
ncbi:MULTISPECIES: hypothetical protein [unclassified Microcoleus]|uniref:hypothetical protein n=1 Tax=unclassified Microcoleus TaxID=2642155 RepID=UPI002FD2FA8B